MDISGRVPDPVHGVQPPAGDGGPRLGCGLHLLLGDQLRQAERPGQEVPARRDQEP